MGTMEGFLLGQALSPTPEYNSGPLWKARAQHEESNALWWKAEAEKLSASLNNKNEQVKKLSESLSNKDEQVKKLSDSLNKEHQRFLIERRERKGYMRGWQTRGAILRENCGYTSEKIDAEAEMLGIKYDEKYTRISKETDAKIDAEAGF